MILLLGLLGSGLMSLIRYFEVITISYWWCLMPVALSLLIVLLRQILRSTGGYSGSSGYDDGGSIYSDMAFWSIIYSSDFGDSGGSDWGGGFGGGDSGDGGGGGGCD